MNLTTNEMFNYKRYSYLKNGRGKYYNPFSRGPIYNLAEFFLCVQPVEASEELTSLQEMMSWNVERKTEKNVKERW